MNPGEQETAAQLARPVYQQDPVTDLMGIFDDAFRTVLPNRHAGESIGLRGLSEKISGNPGWYLWLKDCHGAYLLELVRAELRSRKEGTSGPVAAEGTFVVKYYPSPDDPECFGTFSSVERTVRESDFFDETGTPVFEAADELPEPLFTVGWLEAVRSADGHEVELILEAPNRWKVRSPGTQNGGEPGASTVDRDVSAWWLSWELFDFLLTMLCLARRTAPASVDLFEEPGCTWVVDGEGGATEQRDETVVQRRLTAVLSNRRHGECGCAGTTDPVTLFMESEKKTVAHCHRAPTENRDWIAPRWWEIGGVVFPELTVSFCCCEDEPHHHAEEETSCCSPKT